MIHPHTELRFISEEIGYGVVATEWIPRGTIAWTKDDFDQCFTPEQVRSMEEHYQRIVSKYCYIDARGQFVLCWDHARWVNHSCEPTLRPAGYDFEIAVRDIRPGEELTDDYGSLNLQYDFMCACKLPTCRKVILPTDLETYAASWDQAVADAFRLISKVPQPLWPLVKEKREIEAVLRGETAPRSCRAHYCARESTSAPDATMST